VRVWEAEEKSGSGEAGTIIHSSSEGIDVATGKGVIRLLKLQLPGGRVLTAAELLHSRASEFAVGKSL
jgi:methionyl-tRNA formyltransferase